MHLSSYCYTIVTVLAKICDTNAVMLMKLHVDSITMAIIRGLSGGGSGARYRRRRSSSVIRDNAPLSSKLKNANEKKGIRIHGEITHGSNDITTYTFRRNY